MRYLILVLIGLPISGCSNITVSVLSSNNLLTTRSVAADGGSPETHVEGGGDVDGKLALK